MNFCSEVMHVAYLQEGNTIGAQVGTGLHLVQDIPGPQPLATTVPLLPSSLRLVTDASCLMSNWRLVVNMSISLLLRVPVLHLCVLH